MPFAIAAILAVLLFILLLTGTVAGPWFIIGIPVILVVGLFLMLRSAAEESAGGASSAAPEPTGVPRSGGSSNGGAAGDTANERVGQV